MSKRLPCSSCVCEGRMDPEVEIECIPCDEAEEEPQDEYQDCN